MSNPSNYADGNFESPHSLYITYCVPLEYCFTALHAFGTLPIVQSSGVTLGAHFREMELQIRMYRQIVGNFVLDEHRRYPVHVVFITWERYKNNSRISRTVRIYFGIPPGIMKASFPPTKYFFSVSLFSQLLRIRAGVMTVSLYICMSYDVSLRGTNVSHFSIFLVFFFWISLAYPSVVFELHAKLQRWFLCRLLCRDSHVYCDGQ